MRFLILPCDELPTVSLRGLFSGGLRGAGTFPLPEKPLPTPNFLLFASRFMLSNLARAYCSGHAMPCTFVTWAFNCRLRSHRGLCIIWSFLLQARPWQQNFGFCSFRMQRVCCIFSFTATECALSGLFSTRDIDN